jgi:CO/xanthine dehydrogenase Mo-binding subunit
MEARDKVTGRAKYNDDFYAPGLLYAKMVTSPHAHARILRVNPAAAAAAPGVQAVLTGSVFRGNYGQFIADRPPLARDVVRYCGEPIALVVANSELEAAFAAGLVKVDYEPLPVVTAPGEAIRDGAPLVHPELGTYGIIVPEVRPEPGTNIANRVKIRKGDMAGGWADSEVIIECRVSLPENDHAAMETRSTIVEIQQDGQVVVHTATQAPFGIKKLMAHLFQLSDASITVITPLVGGAFGGKTTAQLELLAYLASRAVGGRAVKIANTREEDLISSPCHTGMEAEIKLGARKDGRLVAAQMTYRLNSGAYSDSCPTMAKAIAAACTGPYAVPNVSCDALTVYTNLPYVTAYRGFGHGPLTFAVERAMDQLAEALRMDPLELRLLNAISPGDVSPTQERLTASSLGDVSLCLQKMRTLIGWEEGQRVASGAHKVRAKGLSCFWKTSSSPVNAISGALLTMNKDGTINLNCGVAELGQGTKTALAQVLAERLKMDIGKIHVVMEVNTDVSPEHWKTVASKSLYMAGNAVLLAAEDLVAELRAIGAVVLRNAPDELEVGESRVYLRQDPDVYVEFSDLAHGHTLQNAYAIGGQIMARGSFIMRHLSPLDPEIGKGKPGSGWTVGCQAVEVELDTEDFTYQILRAATVVDAGRVINQQNARSIVTGGMCMGLSWGSREELVFDQQGAAQNAQLRTYKLMRYAEQPEYLVQFVETPQLDAPYGQRGLGELGLLGMPAALASALSAAIGVQMNKLPLTPEAVWLASTGGRA